MNVPNWFRWVIRPALAFILVMLFSPYGSTQGTFSMPSIEVPLTQVTYGETSIAVNPLDNNHMVVAQYRSGSCATPCPDSFVYHSRDGGHTWLGYSSGPTTPRFDPSVTFDSRGKIYFSSLPSDVACAIQVVSTSSDGGATFGPDVTVMTGGGLVRFASGDYGRILCSDVRGPWPLDFDKIAADASPASPYRDNVYLINQAVLDTNNDGVKDWRGLVMARLRAGAATWDEPLALSSAVPDGAIRPISALNIAVGPQGLILIPEFDGVNIVVHRSDDGGTTFTRSVAVPAEAGGFNNFGAHTSVAIHSDDASVAHLAFYAISSANSARGRDIFVARSSDGGNIWTSSLVAHVNDDSTGALQQTPLLSVARTGRIDVVWFDHRFNSDSVLGDTYYASSADGGSTWSANLRLTPSTLTCCRSPVDYASVASLPGKAIAAYWRQVGGPLPLDFVRHIYANSSFFDDFDDGEIGDWTLNVGTGNTVEVSTAQSLSPPYSLRALKAGGNSNVARATSKSVDLDYAQDYLLKMRFYLPVGVDQGGMLIADDGRAYVGLIKNAGTQLWVSGANKVLTTPVTHGIWHELQMLYRPAAGTFDAILDGTTTLPGFTFNGAPLKQLSVGTDAVKGKRFGEVFFDDLQYFGAPRLPVTLFFDDFNDGTITDWTIQKSGSSVVGVSPSPVQTPPYSLFVQYAGTDIARATSQPTGLDVSKPYTVALNYYVPQPPQIYNDKYLVVLDDGRLEIRNKVGYLYATTASGDVLLRAVANNTWQRIEVRADPTTSTYRVLIQGVEYGSFAFKASSTNDKLMLGSTASPNRRQFGEAYWDDITVSGLSK